MDNIVFREIPLSQNFEYKVMNRMKRPLVTDRPVEFDEWAIEIHQDFGENYPSF
jgi:hypothetical protein